MAPDVCGGVRQSSRSGNRKETVGTRDSGGDSVTSGRASDRRAQGRLHEAKPHRARRRGASHSGHASWPALGQEVGQQTVPGEVAGREDGREESEKPADKAAEQASDKKTDGDWGFRWDGRPSLHLGEELASISACDFSTRSGTRTRPCHWTTTPMSTTTTTSMPMSLAGASASRARSSTSSTIRSSESSRPTRSLRDVYLNYKQHVRLRGGDGRQVQGTFSLDENTSSTNLDFVNRSRIATLLAPGRDVGVMVHGRFLPRGILRYELGLFNEDGSNAGGTTPITCGDRTVAGRLLVQPFRSTKSVRTIWRSARRSRPASSRKVCPASAGRTGLDEWFYRPEVLVNGRRQRIGVEARWRPGPFRSSPSSSG